MCLYKVEEISYCDSRRYIVCQDKNGPCPLIAVANYIILHRGFNVKPDNNGYVSQKYLFTLVRIHLNSNLAELFQEDEVKASQVKELLALLPNFANCLFINPYVNSISGFHKTPELTLMEYLRIPLFHDWIVDDKDSKTAGHDITQRQDEITTPKLIKDFMDNTKTQLTSHGVSCLRDHMLKEGNELAVLYRNGHFHLMHMHCGILLTLLTGVGIWTIHPDTVWQTLDPVYGDMFVAGNFYPINNAEESILYLQHQLEFVTRGVQEISDAEKLANEEIAALSTELEEARKQKHEKSLENFAIKAAEASNHGNELLEIVEKEKLKKEKNAKKKKKRKELLKIQKNTEVLQNVAPGTTPPQQEQSIEVIPDGAPPGTTPPPQVG